MHDIFIRNAGNSGTEFVSTKHELVTWNLDKPIPLEVKKGSLVLLNGEVVHASAPNRSPHSRHADVVHPVDLEYEWPPRNWLECPNENLLSQ